MAKTISEIKKIVERLTKLLEERGISVERVILYGSYASGCAREDSDIDLVIISSDLKKFPPLKRLEFLSNVSWQLPEPLEVIGYTPDEIKDKQGKSIFWDEINSTGKILYEAA